MANFYTIRNNIRKAGFFFPVTVYCLVFAVIAILCGRQLSNNKINADSSFADIFSLLVKVAAWFCVIIICFAFVFVAISFIHFLVNKRKKGISIKIETTKNENPESRKQAVNLKIHPILKPLFGFIKLRLLYDEKHYSNKFSLLESSRKGLFSTSLEGSYNWMLPEIKEYKVQKAILYFEDVFQFFSLAISVPASSSFFTQPTSQNIQTTTISPRKTEETNTRIEQLRKVEGEFLNYKNFENNDDVRRIVWKIYAKNKELVVRTPEIMDPYASHAYLYSSFYSSINVEGNEIAEIPFLNYFKIITWSVYQQLVKQGLDVKYIADQELSKGGDSDYQQWVKFCISTSYWHQNQDLTSFVKLNDASIIIVSSLSDAEQLQQLVDNGGRDISFVFVKLTDSLKEQNSLEWVQWLFVQSEQKDIEVYKRRWAFSPLRNRLKDNEQKLEEILQKADKLVLE